MPSTSGCSTPTRARSTFSTEVSSVFPAPFIRSASSAESA